MLLLTNACGNDFQFVVILKVFMGYHPAIISCAITASLLFTGTGGCLSFGRKTSWRRLQANCATTSMGFRLMPVRIRMRADVPVGSYLSGGLDSSIVTSMIVNNFDHQVRTFGITFEEADYDEAAYQNEMVNFLQCCHSEIQATNESIGSEFQEAVWHCEKPLLRTSPIPMLRLSRLTFDNRLKLAGVTKRGVYEKSKIDV